MSDATEDSSDSVSVFTYLDDRRGDGYGYALLDTNNRVETPYLDPSEYPDLQVNPDGVVSRPVVYAGYCVVPHSGVLEENPLYLFNAMEYSCTSLWLVAGRVPGDDDDSPDVYEAESVGEAEHMFTSDIHAGELPDDWQDAPNPSSEDGQWSYITSSSRLPYAPIRRPILTCAEYKLLRIALQHLQETEYRSLCSGLLIKLGRLEAELTLP